MDLISKIFEESKFSFEEGAFFITVTDWWSNVVSLSTYYRLYLITDGAAELRLTDKTYNLKAGYLYLIPSFSVVSGNCEKMMSHYFVHFMPDSPNTNLLFKHVHFQRETPAPPIAEELFKLVIENIHGSTTYAGIVRDSAIKLLLSNFFKDITQVSADFLRFKDIITYINDNIKSRITVKELADLAFLNKVYFSNLFVKIFGISPQGYIINQKIDAICALLADKNLSIKEISCDFGFSDEAYFSRLFKSKTKLSPKEFRNMLLKGKA